MKILSRVTVDWDTGYNELYENVLFIDFSKKSLSVSQNNENMVLWYFQILLIVKHGFYLALMKKFLYSSSLALTKKALVSAR